MIHCTRQFDLDEDCRRLAQLEDRRFAEREVVSSNAGRTINQGL